MTLPPGIRIAWRAVPARSSRRDTSRALLAEMLPGAGFVSRCPLCGGDHGRIRVEGEDAEAADAAVSVSYVPGWAVVAVTREHARIGVDAAPADAAGLDRVLPGAADARAWARAEAVLKADGRGLAVDPARVSVHESTDGWCARIIDRPDGRHSTTEWRGWDLDGPEGVVAAVAVDAPAEAHRRARTS